MITERQQGQLKSEYDYDAMGRLSEHRVLSQRQKHAVIQRHYHYTSSGNLDGIDDLNKGSTRYFYDAIDRLKEVEGFVNEQFDFDPANNLIQQSEQSKQPKADHQVADSSASSEKSQRFDEHSNVFSLDKAREEKQAQGNRLAFQGDRHFTYDQRGNLIKEARGKNGKLITSYTYNAQNQLVGVDNCGTKTQYQYDALGRRTKKTGTEQETEFLWDGDVLLSETQHLKINEQEQVPNTKATTAKIYVFEPYSFKPLAQIQNNEIYHYHLDHLGTPQELTNNCGNIVWSARYKTYGNLALKEVDDVENNLRFQGQYFDQETGLHYNRHRYYNPNTGQFTQQDPIGLLGGLNNYQYAPNPVGWVDPFGLTCKEELLRRIEESRKARGSSNFEVLVHVEKAQNIESQLVSRPLSNAEIRTWYNEKVAVIPKMNSQWERHGFPLEVRAKNAHAIRHDARIEARLMMSDPIEVENLKARDIEKYKNPDGPTFEYLVAKETNKGATKEEAWEYIIGSSNRTDAEYNKKFGINKKE